MAALSSLHKWSHLIARFDRMVHAAVRRDSLANPHVVTVHGHPWPHLRRNQLQPRARNVRRSRHWPAMASCGPYCDLL